MAVELYDTHCHLLHGELAHDPDAVWARAREAGVAEAVVVGITAESSEEVVAWVAERDGLHAAVGIHPNEVAKAAAGDWERIVALARKPEVVAIGETGLDLYWDEAPLALQESFLDRHAELALEVGRPLILHLRDAYDRAAVRLEPWARRGLRAVVHCFGGRTEEIHPFVDWGWPISFSGILTYPKAENVREAARRTPLAQTFVETDAPWLTPAAHRGRTNEPAFVAATAAVLASVHGETAERIAAVTTANARAFFARG
ncbi:MAG: TatD family hydrolase [Thermoanaerobaculia bacterium]